MNKGNAHLFLPLVKALSEGKTIQIRFSSSEAWADANNLGFDSAPENYRIKPEPRVLWHVVNKTRGHVAATFKSECGQTEKDVKNYAENVKSTGYEYEIVKYVEEVKE